MCSAAQIGAVFSANGKMRPAKAARMPPSQQGDGRQKQLVTALTCGPSPHRHGRVEFAWAQLGMTLVFSTNMDRPQFKFVA
jgi:hypothetical protein